MSIKQNKSSKLYPASGKRKRLKPNLSILSTDTTRTSLPKGGWPRRNDFTKGRGEISNMIRNDTGGPQLTPEMHFFLACVSTEPELFDVRVVSVDRIDRLGFNPFLLPETGYSFELLFGFMLIE